MTSQAVDKLRPEACLSTCRRTGNKLIVAFRTPKLPGAMPGTTAAKLKMSRSLGSRTPAGEHGERTSTHYTKHGAAHPEFSCTSPPKTQNVGPSLDSRGRTKFSWLMADIARGWKASSQAGLCQHSLAGWFVQDVRPDTKISQTTPVSTEPGSGFPVAPIVLKQSKALGAPWGERPHKLSGPCPETSLAACELCLNIVANLPIISNDLSKKGNRWWSC